jgi:hypothetical protein
VAELDDLPVAGPAGTGQTDLAFPRDDRGDDRVDRGAEPSLGAIRCPATHRVTTLLPCGGQFRVPGFPKRALGGRGEGGWSMLPMAISAPDDRAPHEPGIVVVRSSAILSAADILQPELERGQAMLCGELADVQTLLHSLDEAEWHLPTVRAGWTVRDLVLQLISSYESICRGGRALPARVLAGARQRRQDAARAGASTRQIMHDLGYWGGELTQAIPRSRKTSNQFRVALPRITWMARTDIAEATGRRPLAGPHGGEIVRQAVRDAGGSWSGAPVLLEITGPAGGRWLAGDGPPAVTIRTDAVSYLRLVSGRQARRVEVSGDTPFLAIRV